MPDWLITMLQAPSMGWREWEMGGATYLSHLPPVRKNQASIEQVEWEVRGHDAARNISNDDHVGWGGRVLLGLGGGSSGFVR